MPTIVLFLISLLLRLIGANQSFWLDEGSSISLARLPLTSYFTSVAGDFHPPLFYLLLHFWLLVLRVFSVGGEWLIRLPFIAIGALTIPAFYLLLQELNFKQKIPLIAALLLAINPLHLYYSQELRMYSTNALLSVLSWLFLVRWTKSRKNSSLAIFALVSIANLYTFYGAIFNLVAQWVYLMYKKKTKIKSFLVANIAIAITFLPWLPTLLKQIRGGGYLVSALSGWSLLSGTLSVKSVGLIFAKLTLGRISFADKTVYTLFVMSIILYLLLSSLLAYKKFKTKIFLTWMFIPLLIGMVMSLKTPVLGYWRYLFILPAFISLLVLGLATLPRQIALINLAAIALIFIAANVVFWSTPAFQREDWRAAAALINQPDALSIVNFPGVFAPLEYYAPGAFYYPDEEKLGVLRSDILTTLPPLLKQRPRVFVFDYLSDLTDPHRLILSWLKNAGLKLKTTHNINGVGFIYEFTPPN